MNETVFVRLSAQNTGHNPDQMASEAAFQQKNATLEIKMMIRPNKK
jgi:hypothetical protein